MSGHYSQSTDDLSAHAPSHHCCVINDPAVIQRDDSAFVNLLCGDVTRSSCSPACFSPRFSLPLRADVQMPVNVWWWQRPPMNLTWTPPINQCLASALSIPVWQLLTPCVYKKLTHTHKYIKRQSRHSNSRGPGQIIRADGPPFILSSVKRNLVWPSCQKASDDACHYLHHTSCKSHLITVT